VVILTIVITMFLIRTLGQAAGGAVSPQDVALLLGFVTLENLPTMLSLSLFIAVVTTLTRMYRDSEMVIWFASGVGLLRFLRPVMRLSWPMLLAVAVMALFVWPWGNRQVEDLKDRYQRRSDVSRVAPGQFQTSADGRRTFFIDRETGEGTQARNVFVLDRDVGVETVTSARSGHLELKGDDRYVILERGTRTDINLATLEKKIAHFDVYRALAGERVTSNEDNLPDKARSTLQLMSTPTPRHMGELVWRAGLAVAGINLVLLGVGLSAGNPRRGGSWNLMFALLAFVVYYNLLNLTQAWVGSGRFRFGPTFVVVHGGTFLVAITLIWWRERGTAWSLRRRRPAA
jgi:lipopolysaccharide export system permease protein